MGYETILYQVDDRVALITLNRPERLNAFSRKLRAEVCHAIRTADEDPEVRVLVITGAGDKAFSAGYDMKETAESPKRTPAEQRRAVNEELHFTYSVWNCSKPVVAMINGYCLAGALEFAMMCDVRFASDDAQFGVVETRFCAGIATQIMPWIVGPRCREFMLTGDMFDAQEAFRIGLVNRVLPKSALRLETMTFAKRMSRVALTALQCNKRAINHTFEVMGLHAALQYGVEMSLALDTSPEYAAFDELRRAKGLAEALKWRDAQFAPYESSTSGLKKNGGEKR